MYTYVVFCEGEREGEGCEFVGEGERGRELGLSRDGGGETNRD